MRKVKIPQIAVVYPISVPWIATCMDGVRRYARSQGGWHLFTSPPTLAVADESALTLRSMRGWKGDAIIALSNNEKDLRGSLKMKIPIVNLAGGLSKSCGVPRVLTNNFESGKIAANHLLEQGLSRLAFFGWKNLWYSEQRCQGFLERAREAGASCNLFLQDPGQAPNQNWSQRIAGPVKWLSLLPKPCGIFAVHDYRAQLLMEACQELGLRIPDDIALIGMDNDDTICDHLTPTLTSISRNSERLGWEAAALLDRMMQGKPAPTEDLILDAGELVMRQSTDMTYSSDPLAQQSIVYMREQLKTNFNISLLAEHLGVSKRTLETRFRAGTNNSPHEYLLKLRIRQARVLLQTPKKENIEHISLACGFSSSQTFCAAFKRVTGQSPAHFRKAFLKSSARSS